MQVHSTTTHDSLFDSMLIHIPSSPRIIVTSTTFLLVTGSLLILHFTRTPIYIPHLSLEQRQVWTRLSPEFRRRELVAAFDPIETELELGLKLGKTVGVDEYYQGLENFQREYMTNRTDLFDSISQRTISTSQLPRQIYTTAASSIPDLPIEFNSWIELNKGWKMGYFSDQGIEDWLEEMLSGSKVVEEFHQIKRGVLRGKCMLAE